MPPSGQNSNSMLQTTSRPKIPRLKLSETKYAKRKRRMLQLQRDNSSLRQSEDSDAIFSQNYAMKTEKSAKKENHAIAEDTDGQKIEEAESQPVVEQPEKGVLDPFKSYTAAQEEPVDINLVKQSSHKNFTYHEPLPPDFDRSKIMTAELRQQFIELQNKIDAEKAYKLFLQEEKWIIGRDIVNEIIEAAASDLFSQPVASDAPPDSFAEDYEPDFWVKIEEEINARRLEKLRLEME